MDQPLNRLSDEELREKVESSQADQLLSIVAHGVRCALPASKQGKLVLDHVACRIDARTLCAVIGPSGAGLKESNEIAKVLGLLHLTEVRDSMVGSVLERGISGGEAKRLSIAVGLLSRAAILLLDEPTSGLDSRAALGVMRTLHSLVHDQGITVVCSLHQPRSNIYNLLDNLLLLHRGRTVYFGQAQQLGDYIKHHLKRPLPSNVSLADFALDVLYEDDVHSGTMEQDADIPRCEDFASLFVASAQGQALQADLDELTTAFSSAVISTGDEETRRWSYPTSFSRQVYTLVRRTAVSVRRDRSAVVYRISASVVLGTLLVGVAGGMYFSLPNDRSHLWPHINVFCYGSLLCFLFCLPALSRFIDDRVLFIRERQGGYYSSAAYFLAITIVEFPILAAAAFSFGAISFFMTGMEPSKFAVFVLVLTLMSLDGYAATQLITVLVTSPTVALVWYAFLVAFMFMFGGTITSISSLPYRMQWLTKTSPFFWSFAGMMQNEYSEDGREQWADVFMEDRGVLVVSMWTCILIMFALFVFLRIAAVVALHLLY